MTPTLAVFGISGRTGQALLAVAVAAGWRVRGLVRSGVALPEAELIVGALSDAGQVQRAVSGANAVCCVFGQRPPYRDVFCESATRTIIDAMRVVGCDRLVCLTGAMIGSGQGVRRSRPMEWLARWFARRQPDVARDRAGQERVVIESRLPWTIVKPPRLVDGHPRGHVQAGPGVRVGLRSSIRRADLAAFLIREAEECTFLRSRVVVTG